MMTWKRIRGKKGRIVLGETAGESPRSRIGWPTPWLGAVCSIAVGLGMSANVYAITKAEADLIDEGFRLFTEETFGGNGRTCSTCHIPEANYTISPKDIEKMSRKERKLVFARNVPKLENKKLVEKRALFNVGPGDGTLEFPVGPFRGSMTVAALEITSFNNFRQAPPVPPVFPPRIETGWGGDGSPGAPGDGSTAGGSVHHGFFDPTADGSIAAFAQGAIAQHNTKSLARVPGVDFRLAIPAELKAMDAFQRWLGRRPVPKTPPNKRAEFELALLKFTDPRVEAGKALFMSDEATCNACHTNGGAHFNLTILPAPPPGLSLSTPFSGANILQNTGIDKERVTISAAVGVNIPKDIGNEELHAAFGVELFNLQSVIEAPRKDVFFHNSAVVGYFEEAIETYFKPPFAREVDAAGNPIPGTGAPQREAFAAIGLNRLDTLEDFEAFGGPNAINKLGAFMRVLSAYYSIRDCERLVWETIDRIKVKASPHLSALHCGFDLDDVRDVLEGAKVYPKPHKAVYYLVKKLKYDLQKAAKRRDKVRLFVILKMLGKLRTSIAVTTEAQ